MDRESGNKNSSIWLIGDSSPQNWSESLDKPLDSRHPARHNIWTPILDGVQKEVFVGDRRRVDDSNLYVRNAIHNPTHKPPGSSVEWGSTLSAETESFGKLLGKYEPMLVFTFGAFAFEFARRSLKREPGRSFGYWTTRRLGEKFRQSVEEFNPEGLNVFPLLHVTIARGKFLKSHENFTESTDGNYFDLVAGEIGKLLLGNKDKLNIWLQS